MSNKEFREYEVELSEDKIVKLTTRTASNEELQQSEFEFSRAFNHAIMKGIMPQAKLLFELSLNGVWTEEDDEKINTQRDIVISLEEAIESVDDEDRERVSEDLKEERNELYRLRQARTDLVSHSAEAKAEEAQRNYLVWLTTEYSDTKKRVWKTFEDFKKEENGNLLFRSTYEYLTFINDLPTDFMNQLPENQVAEEEAPEVESDEEVSVIAENPEAPVPAEPTK